MFMLHFVEPGLQNAEPSRKASRRYRNPFSGLGSFSRIIMRRVFEHAS